MKMLISCVSALALVATLSACGQSAEPTDNAVVNAEINAMMTEPEHNMVMEAVPANEPAAATPAPVAEPAAKTAEPKAAAPKPAPAPAKPKPAEPATDPHAGHDMNNMQ